MQSYVEQFLQSNNVRYVLHEHKKVELFIDQEVYDADIVSFHPNINTASIELSQEMFHKFLNSINHKAHVVKL